MASMMQNSKFLLKSICCSYSFLMLLYQKKKEIPGLVLSGVIALYIHVEISNLYNHLKCLSH